MKIIHKTYLLALIGLSLCLISCSDENKTDSHQTDNTLSQPTATVFPWDDLNVTALELTQKNSVQNILSAYQAYLQDKSGDWDLLLKELDTYENSDNTRDLLRLPFLLKYGLNYFSHEPEKMDRLFLFAVMQTAHETLPSDLDENLARHQCYNDHEKPINLDTFKDLTENLNLLRLEIYCEEGWPNLILNLKEIQASLQPHLTPVVQEYLLALQLDPIVNDTALNISYNTFWSLIDTGYDVYQNATWLPDGQREALAKKLGFQLEVLLFGMDNTHIDSEGAIHPEVKKIYMKIVLSPKDNLLRNTLKDYIERLSKRNFQFEPNDAQNTLKAIFPDHAAKQDPEASFD